MDYGRNMLIFRFTEMCRSEFMLAGCKLRCLGGMDRDLEGGSAFHMSTILCKGLWYFKCATLIMGEPGIRCGLR